MQHSVSTFACCLMTAVFFMSCANASPASESTASESLACPGLGERMDFYVEPVNPRETYEEVKRTALLAETFAGQADAGQEGESRDAIEESAASSIDRSLEEKIVDELVEWMEARASAEMHLWIIDSLKDQLCEPERADFFPASCSMLSSRGAALAITRSQAPFVEALRQDLRHVPACAIYQNGGNEIGYLLMNVYEQYRHGENIDHLIYGLSKHDQLKRLITGDPDEKCINTEGDVSPGCQLALPVIAYASALHVEPLWELYMIAEKAGDSYAADEYLKQTVEAYRRHFVNAVGGAYRNVLPESAKLEPDDLAAFMKRFRQFEMSRQHIESSLRNLTREKLEYLSEHDRLKRINDELSTVGRELASLLAISPHLMLNGNEELRKAAVEVERGQRYVSALFKAQNALATASYSEAFLELSPIILCLTEKPETAQQMNYACPKVMQLDDENARERLQWLNHAVYTVALLADVDDAEGFSKSLDAISSPVGAYRLRHETELWSLNGYLGGEYGVHWVDIPDYGRYTYWGGEVFAPLGVTWTHPECGLLGACGVHLQLLNVGVLAGDYTGHIEGDGFEVESEAKSNFRSILTPGLYFVFSPEPTWPVTVGVGMSVGPTRYKQAIYENGKVVDVDQRRMIGAFVAVDLVIFSFGH